MVASDGRRRAWWVPSSLCDASCEAPPASSWMRPGVCGKRVASLNSAAAARATHDPEGRTIDATAPLSAPRPQLFNGSSRPAQHLHSAHAQEQTTNGRTPRTPAGGQRDRAIVGAASTPPQRFESTPEARRAAYADVSRLEEDIEGRRTIERWRHGLVESWREGPVVARRGSAVHLDPAFKLAPKDVVVPRIAAQLCPQCFFAQEGALFDKLRALRCRCKRSREVRQGAKLRLRVCGAS